MNISILAAGTWGTALAAVLSQYHRVTVWSVSPQEVEQLSATRAHPNLPGLIIPEAVAFTGDLQKAVSGTDVIILATPSVYVRSTAEKLREFIAPGQIVACVAKGMEAKTLYTMSDVIDDVLQKSNPVVALSGPTHAEEVAKNLPTLIVSSSLDHEAAKTVQNLFVGTCIRPYTNWDIKGIELCGAMKNIIALACGIAAGLGYGDNTRAAIMTRGMAEIRTLGIAMGCREETFFGLAGIGDLIVTATSQHSRNNRAGRYIGQGMAVQEAVEKVGMVVEGVYALPAAMELSARYNVELPIIHAVNDIIEGTVTAEEAVNRLLNRNVKPEFHSDLRLEDDLLRAERLK